MQEIRRSFPVTLFPFRISFQFPFFTETVTSVLAIFRFIINKHNINKISKKLRKFYKLSLLKFKPELTISMSRKLFMETVLFGCYIHMLLRTAGLRNKRFGHGTPKNGHP